MRVEVLSLCLVTAALSYFFPAKVQGMSSCTSNGFTRGPPNLTLTVGDTGIVLSCETDAPGLAIQWIHTLNGKELERIDSFMDRVLEVFIASTTGNLTLRDEVSVRHHGEYQCTLQAPCNELFSDIGHINVTGPSLIQLDKNSQVEYSGKFKSQLVIGINVFGSPQPSFTLLKKVQSNKRAVEEFQEVDISDGHISINLTMIKFSSIEFTDEGSYQLWANNSEGGSVIKFRVDVTAATIIHSTSLPSNTQSPVFPPSYASTSLLLKSGHEQERTAFINSATSSSYVSTSPSLESGHEPERTAVTIIHSTSLHSNIQSPLFPPSYASTSLLLESGHEQERTVTIIHSTSLPSNTQSSPPPPSIEPDSEPNLIIVIVSVVVATVIILILVVAILVTFMCVKNKQQRQPTLSAEVAVCDTNLKSTSVSRNPITMSCDYDESVELKFNSPYGVVSPKPLKNVATSPNSSYLSTISQDGIPLHDPIETSYETIQDNSQECYSSMYTTGSLEDTRVLLSNS